MAKKAPVAQLYYIEWEDACGAPGWNDAGGVQQTDLALCYSVGWAIAESKKALTLVSSYNSEDQVDGHITIPVANIRKRVKLRKVR